MCPLLYYFEETSYTWNVNCMYEFIHENSLRALERLQQSAGNLVHLYLEPRKRI